MDEFRDHTPVHILRHDASLLRKYRGIKYNVGAGYGRKVWIVGVLLRHDASLLRKYRGTKYKALVYKK